MLRFLLDRYADFLVRYPWVGWLFLIAATAVSVCGWLGIGTDDRDWVEWTDNSDKEVQREIENGIENRQTFYLRVPTSCVYVIEGDDFFSEDRWRALQELEAEIVAEDKVAIWLWIGSLPDFWVEQAPPVRFDLPMGDVANLFEPTPYEQMDWDAFRHQARENPIVHGNMLSKDGKTLLIQYEPYDDTNEYAAKMLRTARRILEPVGLSVRLTGRMPIARAHQKAFDQSHFRVLGSAALVIVIMAVVTFRDIRSLMLVGVGPVLSIVWTLGVFELTGEPNNELTDIVLPVMIIMVAFADVVHLVIDMQRHLAAGDSPREAVKAAIHRVGPACVMTSITTSVGFGSLMLSDSHVIHSFGRASAIGVMISLVSILLATPLFCLLLRGTKFKRVGTETQRPNLGYQETRRSSLALRLRQLSTIPVVKAPVVFLVAIAVLIALIAQSSRLRPDDRLADRIPNGSEAWQAFNHCEQAFGGIVFLEIMIEWPQDASIDQVDEVIGRVESLTENQELIETPLSVRDWLAVIPGDEADENRLMAATLLPGEIQARFWNLEMRRTLVLGRLQDRGLVVYDPILADLRTKLDVLNEDYPDYRFTMTGIPIQQSRVVRHVVRELFDSFKVAALIIFAILSISLRSIWLGLICVIPNAFPLFAAGALRACFGPSLDIASACAFVIALGIAVDDTIHLIARYQYEKQQGGTHEDIIVRAIRAAGRPMVMTSIVLVIGIGTVATSGLPTHQHFATIACSTLASALVADLVILPAMLKLFTRAPSTSASE